VAARREAFKIAARAVERQLNQDQSDYTGPARVCPCGHQDANYAGRRRKTIDTVLGQMTLDRAYYHCPNCGSGWFPRDHALGMAHVSISPALTRMIGFVGALVSFEEGSELLRELAGVAVDSKRVERTAEALGREIATDERTYTEPLAQTDVASTLYLGMDGTGIPMRKEELTARAGKQPDGTAKTREVKLCTVWSAEGRDSQTGLPTRDPGSVSYTAAIESAAQRGTDSSPGEFAARVEREAMRRDFDKADRRVVLGDGAAWIWNIASELFPDAVQIVDRYHANEHLSDASKSIYGAEGDLARSWARQRHEELNAGKIDQVLAILRVHASGNEEARKCADYLEHNRDRMRYPEFHAAGLCTSTGVVEAGCKVAIGTRLKRAGMHWTVRGANAIIALRCTKLSGRFEDFWERRAAALSPAA
jgi:hypothetical protein